MKRRIVSLAATLALCLSLYPAQVCAAAGRERISGMSAGTSSGGVSVDGIYKHILTADRTYENPYDVSSTMLIDTQKFTLTGTGKSAIQVTAAGELYLMGNVEDSVGAGVKVESGGSLCVMEPGTATVIFAATYGLDIDSGAEVKLFAGKYIGKTAAIRTADGDFAALLAPGCAYFDGDGNPVPQENLAAATTLVVGPCTDHLPGNYTHGPGVTEHTWTCQICGTEEAEKCTFDFDSSESGTGTCGFCGNSLTIGIDLADSVYDGTIKDVKITVTLADGSKLKIGTDYTAAYEPRTDAGEITVTVTGITFTGTFTRTCKVEQDQPGIKWDSSTKELDYDGRRTSIQDELPHITISLQPNNSTDLHPSLRYSYRVLGTEAFTDGLPLDAGDYEIKAYLPESQNYKEAVTDPLLNLTIKAIHPVSTPPSAASLTYNGTAQELVTAGVVDPRAAGAEILYAASQNGPFSTEIPTGVNADSYEVWYKVEGTANYNSADPAKVSGVTIQRKQITPVVTLSESSYLYDGGEKRPAVTVRDEDHITVLNDSEYQVVYQNNRNVGTAKVVVSDKSGGNYAINKSVEVEFQITRRTQEALSITNMPDTIFYGDQFTLGTLGGSGDGNVTWKITNGSNVAEVDPDSGQVTVTGHGRATVKATKSGEDPDTHEQNYEDATASWTFEAKEKPVVATVTAEDKTYDGQFNAQVHAVVEQGVLAGDEVIITSLSGTFPDVNAGVDKTVTVVPGSAVISGQNSSHYKVTYSTGTATIRRATAAIETAPQARAPLTYNGSAQDLLTGGSTVGGIGEIVYSLDEEGEYTAAIPQGTNAGTYTVWYRVEETPNYTGLSAASVAVEISKADSSIIKDPTATYVSSVQYLREIALTGGAGSVAGTFAWTNGDVPFVGGQSYEVTFTPTDTTNYNTKTTWVTPTQSTEDDGNGGDTGSTGINDAPAADAPSSVSRASALRTTIQDGAASTVVSAAAGSRLVQEAAAAQSRNIVIKPEITGDVTKAEVSIPASTLSQIGSETGAALTVSAPIADVTIPHAALDTLSRAGDTFSVTAEQVEQTVVMTLAADGKPVEDIPGGVTLTVPAEDAAPGTVAVLVREDGARETIQKSVVQDGKLKIPLSGSATVEIVDNSKDFTDVPSTSWEAGAVAFASAHELFNGTSETAFSPDQAMSRGMLATVLYNLEGHPEQDQPCTFSDVSGDAWYTDSISWAAANGIVSGYSDGQFGPDDNITREQFAVMLWRYAGSPEASGGELNFTDADQAGSYSLEALRWAAANGILNGYGSGRLDPGGLATRAQAAQMLKNFMENT